MLACWGVPIEKDIYGMPNWYGVISDKPPYKPLNKLPIGKPHCILPPKLE